MNPLPRVLVALSLAALPLAPRFPAPTRQEPLSPQEAALAQSLSEQGVHLDTRAGVVSIEAEVLVRDDLLEYLLVGPGGAAHESLLTTRARPSVLNVGLLALGLEPGKNAVWTPKDPLPTREEMRQGIAPYEVTPPQGDALHLYVGWREESQVHFYRVEDLLRDLSAGRTMRRHEFVYLGSRMVPYGRERTETFAADLYQNLICVTYFSDGFTLLTAALPESIEQTIWMANAWLLPPQGSKVALVLSRQALLQPPQSVLARLPELPRRPAGPQDEDR